MPRTARIVVPDIPHHITQRGNNCQDVFFVDDDSGLLDISYWRKISSRVDWQRALGSVQSDEQLESIRRNTHTGRPLVGDAFISKPMRSPKVYRSREKLS